MSYNGMPRLTGVIIGPFGSGPANPLRTGKSLKHTLDFGQLGAVDLDTATMTIIRKFNKLPVFMQKRVSLLRTCLKLQKYCFILITMMAMLLI